MDECREEFENWFLSTPTGKALSAANLDYYIFERQFDEYRDRDVEMAHRAYAYQQAKVEGLQEEFAEDERFLKEQIKDKDLKIANLEYLQGMDKELIQTLQGRSSALQDKVNGLQKRVDTALEVIMEYYTGSYDESPDLVVDLEQALEGEGQ